MNRAWKFGPGSGPLGGGIDTYDVLDRATGQKLGHVFKIDRNNWQAYRKDNRPIRTPTYSRGVAAELVYQQGVTGG